MFPRKESIATRPCALNDHTTLLGRGGGEGGKDHKTKEVLLIGLGLCIHGKSIEIQVWCFVVEKTSVHTAAKQLRPQRCITFAGRLVALIRS